ncbi:hypothetical protein ALC53_04187 [Atta colombica]|uniref:Uncharacterized protein n=1 Tax=Atta colombica TaxID=520822 RepID=A0A195BL00_9HYME|nr:hypothetical protein ALC53_04187 [Atta colombica]
MTGHTHRQKGRNVARLIREGEREARGCLPQHAMEPRGGCSPISPSLTPWHTRLSLSTSSLLTPREIGSACGPRVYLRCSTSRAKYYASVLLCDHPDGDAPLSARTKGLWLRVLRKWLSFKVHKSTVKKCLFRVTRTINKVMVKNNFCLKRFFQKRYAIVLKNSNIYKNAQTIIPQKTLMLHPYHEIILHNCGDLAYPMLSRLIKDYSDSLTAKESFNVLIYLNSARIAVKMVFEMGYKFLEIGNNISCYNGTKIIVMMIDRTKFIDELFFVTQTVNIIICNEKTHISKYVSQHQKTKIYYVFKTIRKMFLIRIDHLKKEYLMTAAEMYTLICYFTFIVRIFSFS